jgi:hypothetical protein
MTGIYLIGFIISSCGLSFLFGVWAAKGFYGLRRTYPAGVESNITSSASFPFPKAGGTSGIFDARKPHDKMTWHKDQLGEPSATQLIMQDRIDEYLKDTDKIKIGYDVRLKKYDEAICKGDEYTSSLLSNAFTKRSVLKVWDILTPPKGSKSKEMLAHLRGDDLDGWIVVVPIGWLEQVVYPPPPPPPKERIIREGVTS